MKIGIYYIATGIYMDFFPDFLKSVKNFFPNDDKVIKLISDNGEKYKGYNEGNIKVDLCPRINHYPWPIITLYKMWHILQNWDDTFDYVCYFNANSIIMPNNTDTWFIPDKLNTSYHSVDGKNKGWNNIKINKESKAYLENGTYEYIQAAFFMGKKEIVKKMCNDVISMVNEDSKKFLYPQWHDESYLNKWCTMHNDLVSKKPLMTIYPNKLNSTTFVFLKNKGNAIKKFKGI